MPKFSEVTTYSWRAEACFLFTKARVRPRPKARDCWNYDPEQKELSRSQDQQEVTRVQKRQLWCYREEWPVGSVASARATWRHGKGQVKYTNPVWCLGGNRKDKVNPAQKVQTFCRLQLEIPMHRDLTSNTQCGVPVSNYPELCLPPTGLTCITIETSMLPAASTHAPATCLREEVLACFFHLHSLC